ncbi:endonuclease [Flavobacteriaceae bacterium]|nr:endonuclease [Flavobacteriaceae bacterium]
MKITSTTKLSSAILYAFLLFSCVLSAQIPDYYIDIDFTKQGDALKSELSTLISDTHTNLIPYTSSSTDTWDVIHESDADVDVQGNVVLIYGYNDSDGVTKNDRTRPIADQSSGFCIGYWNREHVFAKNLANPSLETSSAGPGTDVHNLRAADCQMNSTRNNNLFKDGIGDSFLDGDFYPGDEFKGDVARIMMYMYLRYPTQCEPTNIGVGSTSYSDNSDMPNIFLEWNEQDPVSEFEINRNNVIASYQNNRNPFIDNPYLATLIWNGPDAEDRWGVLSTSYSEYQEVFIHPTIPNDFIYIEGMQLSSDSVEVFNQLGQKLHVILDGNSIDVSRFSKGLYLVSVTKGTQSNLFKFLVN